MILRCLIIMIACFLPFHASRLAAEEFHLDSAFNKGTLRLEIDNDYVWDRDSHFTNAWSIQYYSAGYARWDDTRAPAPVKWVGNHFPTLGDDEAMVRFGNGLGQNMYTPRYLEARSLREGDLPYAGTLTYSLNWQRFNRQSASNLQITLGVLGKESMVEGFQRAAHDVVNGSTEPMGWDTQRDSEPIINIGYLYERRLAHFGTADDGWSARLSLSPSASVGNLATMVELGLGFCFGWNMSEGFGRLPAQPGIGFFQAADIPKSAAASPHSIECILALRGTGLLYSVVYDGSLITGDDRDVEREIFTLAGIVGVVYRYRPYVAVGAYLQRASDLLKPESLPSPERTAADVSYGTLTIDFYF